MFNFFSFLIYIDKNILLCKNSQKLNTWFIISFLYGNSKKFGVKQPHFFMSILCSNLQTVLLRGYNSKNTKRWYTYESNRYYLLIIKTIIQPKFIRTIKINKTSIYILRIVVIFPLITQLLIYVLCIQSMMNILRNSLSN